MINAKVHKEDMYPEEEIQTLITKNILIGKKRTSIKLEPELWELFRLVSSLEGKNINQLATFISHNADTSKNFTSLIRKYLVRTALFKLKNTAP